MSAPRDEPYRAAPSPAGDEGFTENAPTDPAGLAKPELSDPAAPAPPAAPVQPKPSRFGGLWVALVCAAIVLLLLLIFVLQNGQSVQITFFGWEGSLPLGVALLLSAICGILLVAIPGTGRILQLRREARKAGRH